jgi:hypothetical protein
MIDLEPSRRPSILEQIRHRRSEWGTRRQALYSLDAELAAGSRHAIAKSRSLLQRTGGRRTDTVVAEIVPTTEPEAAIGSTVTTLLENISRAEELAAEHERLIHEIENHCAVARRQVREMKAAAKKLSQDGAGEA